MYQDNGGSPATRQVEPADAAAEWPGERVLVIGSPGSGKTMLTRRLAAATGLPAVHLDDWYWKPGWTRPSAEEWARVLDGLLSEERWIIDGNHASSLERRARRADFIVFLDYPTWRCAASAVWRGIRRRLGYRDSLPRAIAEDRQAPRRLRVQWRFVRLILLFRRQTRPAMLRTLQSCPATVVSLRGRREADRLVERLVERLARARAGA